MYGEEEDEVLRFDEDDNADEFACEEIDPDEAPVVVRRARTVKKGVFECLQILLCLPLKFNFNFLYSERRFQLGRGGRACDQR